jgi:Ca-activated chloride channel family protein
MDFLYLHWLRPWWLLALLPVIALLLPLALQSWRDNAWSSICDAHLLPHLLIGDHSRSILFKKVLVFLSFLLVIIALAGPCYKTVNAPVFQSNASRVIVFDLSNATLATDIVPNRLTRARFKLLDVLHALKEGQTGLLAFSQQPFVVSPLTSDSETLVNQVNALSPGIMPVQGYQLTSALLKAKALLQQSGAHTGHIVVFTTQNPTNDDINTARMLAKDGFHIDVLPIGSNTSSTITNTDGSLVKDAAGNIVITSLNPTTLAALAKAGRGQLWSLNTPIDTILKTLNPLAAQKKASDTHDATTKIWLDNGYIWLWPVLILALWAFRKGRLQELLK